MKSRHFGIVTLLGAVGIAALYFSSPVSPPAHPSSISDKAVASPAKRMETEQANGKALFLRDARTAPTWAVRFGKEFWKPERSGPLQTKDQILRSGLIARMKLPFKQDGATGLPVVKAATYKLEMDQAGFRYTPNADSSNGTFHIATQRIIIPGLTTEGEMGEWNVVGNTAQRDRFGNQSVIEHVEAEETGASITWILPKGPVAAQDSQIQVALTGAAMRQNGVIRTGSGALAKWGQTVAVDASGRRTALNSRFESDRIVIELPKDLLASSSYPLAIDPTVTTITPLDPDITPVPKNLFQYKVVGDGATWLLYAEDGLLFLDENGEATAVSMVDSPDLYIWDIAYADNTFVAVGESREDDSLVGQFITKNGGELEFRTPFEIAPALEQNYKGYTNITAEGSAGLFYATWSVYDYDQNIQPDGVTVVSFDNTATTFNAPYTLAPRPIAPGAVRVLKLAGSEVGTCLALLRDDDGNDFTYRVLYITPTAVSSSEFPIPTTNSNIGLAYGPARWLVTWSNYDEEDGYTTRGLRILQNGTVEGSSFEISADDISDSSTLLPSSSCWLQIYVDGGEIRRILITHSGTTTESGTGISSDYYEPIGASGDYSSGVVVLTDDLGNDGTFSLIFDPETAEVKHGPNAVLNGPNHQEWLSVATGASNLLTAWVDEGNMPDYTKVVGVRVDLDGTIIDSTPLDFSSSAAGDMQVAVAIASVGTKFLVAFTAEDINGIQSVRGRICSTGGVLDGAAPFEIGSGIDGIEDDDLAVAANNTSYFVSWLALDANSDGEIRGAVVSQAGVAAASSVLAPAGATTDYYGLTLASDHTKWLLGYHHDAYVAPAWEESICFRLISAVGEVTGSEIVAAEGGSYGLMNVAFSETHYLAAWNSYPTGDDIVEASRIATDGTLFPPVVIATDAYSPNVAPLGDGWAVAVATYDDNLNDTVNIVRVNANGIPESENGHQVALLDAYPVLATTGNGRFFLGLEDYTTDDTRVFGASVQFTEPLITSSATLTGQVGSFFSYTIVATNTPTSYNFEQTLPPGLVIAGNTVSGTPTIAGTYVTTLTATNGGGTGKMDVSFTIAAAPTVQQPADSTPPTLKSPAKVTTEKKSVNLKINTGDAVRILYRVKPPGGKVSAFKSKSASGSVNLKINTPDLGTYTVEVKGIDASGNVSRPRKITVVRKD